MGGAAPPARRTGTLPVLADPPLTERPARRCGRTLPRNSQPGGRGGCHRWCAHTVCRPAGRDPSRLLAGVGAVGGGGWGCGVIVSPAITRAGGEARWPPTLFDGEGRACDPRAPHPLAQKGPTLPGRVGALECPPAAGGGWRRPAASGTMTSHGGFQGIGVGRSGPPKEACPCVPRFCACGPGPGRVSQFRWRVPAPQPADF